MSDELISVKRESDVQVG